MALIGDHIWPDMVQMGLDPARGGLWGHSYGGLFVLSCLYARPDLFRASIAASPSLWWHEGRAFNPLPQAPASMRDLLLICGDAEVNRRVIHGRTLPSPEETVAELKALAARLRQVPRLNVEARILGGFNHGPVFEASLPVAFDFAARYLKEI